MYHKYRSQQEKIYEYAFPPTSKNTSPPLPPPPPPPLPPPRIQDNPAYERFLLKDCVAYESNGLNRDQQLTIQTLSSIVSTV